MRSRKSLYITSIIATLALFLCAAPADVAAQTDRNVNFFIGYGYWRAETGGDSEVGSLNLHGALAEFSYSVTERIGISFEFGGHFGSIDIDVPDIGEIAKINVDVITTMGGPRFNFGNETITGSVHAFFGVARASVDLDLSIADIPGISISEDETKFATAIGGAIDWNLNEAVAIRIIQPSWVLTTFGEETQNHLRIGSGVVFRF